MLFRIARPIIVSARIGLTCKTPSAPAPAAASPRKERALLTRFFAAQLSAFFQFGNFLPNFAKVVIMLSLGKPTIPDMTAEEESAKTTVKPAKSAKKKGKKRSKKRKTVSKPAAYPRHSVDKALRIPKAILEQNAGKDCTVAESAAFLGVGSHGPYQVEVSSGIKYGFLSRPTPGRIAITERAKKVLRPQAPSDALQGLREAVLGAPIIQDVYGHL
jgi:hypothetical protein